MKVLILYDLLAREYWMCNEIKNEIENKGGEAQIFSLNFEYYKALRMAKTQDIDILLIPSCYLDGDYQRVALPLKKYNPNMVVVCMHSEQIGYEGKEEDLLPNSESGKNTMLHLSWGEYFTKQLLSCGIKEGLILEGGNLRFQEFLSVEEKYTRKEMASIFNLDPGKKWIIYCDSGTFLYYEMQTKGEKVKKKNAGAETTNTTVQPLANTFLETVNILNNLSDEVFEKFEIVFRPHPGTNGVHKSFLDKRIKIIRDFTVYTWFRHVEYNIVFMSTSAFESDLCGVKTFRLAPVAFPYEIPGVKEYFKVSCLDELEAVLLDKENKALKSGIYKKFMGECNAEMISSFVDNLFKFSSEDLFVDFNGRVNNKKFYSSIVADFMVRFFYKFMVLDMIKHPDGFEHNKYEHPIFKNKYVKID